MECIVSYCRIAACAPPAVLMVVGRCFLSKNRTWSTGLPVDGERLCKRPNKEKSSYVWYSVIRIPAKVKEA